MTTQPIRIRIPTTVDPALCGNGRGHPMKKHRLAQELKTTTYYVARNANLEMWDAEPPFVLHYVVARAKGKRALDDDNIKAGLKYVQDGIAAALGIDDKHITISTVRQTRDPDGIGFVEVTIEPHPAAEGVAA